MVIKGMSVRNTAYFVKEKYPDRYKEWLNSLPDNIRSDFEFNTIFIGKWYDIKNYLVIPTEKVTELFYNGDIFKASCDISIYSSKLALNTVYKIFLKITNLDYVRVGISLKHITEIQQLK